MKKLVSKVYNSDNHKKNLTRIYCFIFFFKSTIYYMAHEGRLW